MTKPLFLSILKINRKPPDPMRCLLLSLVLVSLISLSGCADMKTARVAYQAGDYTTAAEHYRKLAEFGLPEAQTSYAQMILKGQAGNVDPSLARHYLELASENKYAKADLELANLYVKEDGPMADREKARELYQRASNAGQVRATYQLGRLYEDENQPEKAKALYKQCLDKGYYKAAERLGALSESKTGSNDPVTALAWYYVAQKHAVTNIDKKIDRLEKKLSPAEQEQARQISEGLS
jgi:TPR repeat protein